MSGPDLNTEWAWSRVEAMADASLEGEHRRRMQQCMTRDPDLRAAVERARALRRALRESSRSMPVPAFLCRRLLRVPSRRRRPAGRMLAAVRAFAWQWAALPAASAAAAVVLVTAIISDPVSPPPDPRTAAVREFRTAMTYLQKSAAVASNGVARELGKGISDALSVSRNAIDRESNDRENGG